MTNGSGWREENRLILDVVPSYDNQKKYQGEMHFILTSEQMDELRQAVAGANEKGRRLEIAQAELDEFKAEHNETLLAKKKQLRADLGLEGDPDLPFWLQD